MLKMRLMFLLIEDLKSSLLVKLYLQNHQLLEHKYVYLNELVDEKTISVECEEYIAQNGCGEWHTDYWGFGGKNLYNLSENYPNQLRPVRSQ